MAINRGRTGRVLMTAGGEFVRMVRVMVVARRRGGRRRRQSFSKNVRIQRSLFRRISACAKDATPA